MYKESSVGFYTGSFDPFTLGHFEIVKQASTIFSHLIIGIGINAAKKRRYSKELMKSAIERVLRREKIFNATVIIYEGLSMDVAKANNVNFFVRGLRNSMDYEYEENLAKINEVESGIKTIYLRSGELGYISSSLVTELLHYGRDVSKYLPIEIAEVVYSTKTK